ncbi:MAG TPA: multicopper oxidase family protein [Geminicoccaceae bacterium]|nr:multicopper oxidase family protein [Geminicoccaceae bacterium]
MKLTRRDLARATAVTSLTAVPILRSAAPVAAASGSAGPTSVWDIGAKPDYRLAVSAQEIELFGRKIQGLLAGGSWPGTTIRYNRGDRFRVLVENALDQPTCLHWHGLVDPNLQDGVPGITQAPIKPGDALYYEFDLKQAGTFWYHSHYGLQEQQGLAGPLIIEDPNEPHSYDEDLVVMLSDVIDIPVDDVIPRIRQGVLNVSVSDPYTLPDGAPFRIDVPYTGYLLNGQTPAAPWSHALKAGSRARLRLINGSGSSFFRIALDGLPLTLIAADGDPVEPLVVDNLVIGTAQRYDVLVTLPGSGSYTLHAAALGDDKQAIGVLHTPDVKASANRDRPSFGGKALQLTDLKAPFTTTPPDGPRKSFEIVLSGDMRNYLWEMNGHVWPESFAAFAGDQPQETYYDVAFGDIVRFHLVNRTPMAHPMHLHGHSFRVLVEGADPARAPIRDTFVVWPKGEVSIEVVAYNPGKWFFHCHNIWHLAVGMAQAVQYKVVS